MFGRSDLRDLIYLNTEYNLKTSDISQILDYNAAPTTIVQGAKPHNLERGANKMWCVPEKVKVGRISLGQGIFRNPGVWKIVVELFNSNVRYHLFKFLKFIQMYINQRKFSNLILFTNPNHTDKQFSHLLSHL